MEATQARPMGGKQKQINVGRNERKASVVGGAALALSGLGTMTKKKGVLPGLAMVAAGGMLMYRGTTGHCDLYESIGVDTSGSEDNGLQVEKFLTINRLPQDVYDFWRNLENLPKFLRHLESVQVTGERSSHWRAVGPGEVSVEWDAEIVEDYPGQLIQWHSIGEAEIPNEGLVEFREAPGGRGTEVKVTIRYFPPGGTAGKVAAKIAHAINAQQVEEDLKRLKQILETGETATAERTNGRH